MPTLIDTHTHLYVEEFDGDRQETLDRARQAGVSMMFMPNIDDTSVEAMLSLCNSNDDCFPMIGLHPTSIDSRWESRLDAVKGWLESDNEFCGIGEVGMDLYWDKTYRREQMEALDIQIRWALAYGLPIIIHCREAHEEMMEVLRPYRDTTLTGIFHCFSGTADEAAEMLTFPGFMLGIGGAVTFKKSKIGETLKTAVPLSRVVLETDSPYLAPTPYRGKRNESAYIIKVAEKLGEVYGLPTCEIGRETASNALKVFRKTARTF